MQRCGLCSLLAGLLRRAMCAGGRRGSGDSCATNDSPKFEIVAMHQDDEPVVTPSTSSEVKELSESEKRIIIHTPSDLLLLESLEFSRFMHVGKFMTMHKRRKQRLVTRSLRRETAILDDLQNGQVKCILEQSVLWRFNAFTLENVTGGRSLPVFCLHLFHCYGLLDHFKLDVTCVWKLFTLIEDGYHSTNPYHNSIHAADVTQAMHCFLQQKKIREHLQPIEIMAALIGSVAHDLDHPGVNQPFLIATSNHLASLYQNNSVLENHHWRSGVGCVLESGIAAQLGDLWPALKDQIGSLILATDITRQNEFVLKFKHFVEDATFDLKKAEDRHFVLQIALKCADISNPCRPWDLSRKWSMKVCEEFFRQGDFERKLNLPITSMCDRHTTSIPLIQKGFLKFVVTPLVSEWHEFLSTDLTREMMMNLKINQSKWDSLVRQEKEEEGETEISDAEVIDEEASSSTSSSSSSSSSSSNNSFDCEEPLLPKIITPDEVKCEESNCEDSKCEKPECEEPESKNLEYDDIKYEEPKCGEPICDEPRRYSVPAKLEVTPRNNVEIARRESYHFEEKPSPYKISLADDEKLSFKDSLFLFHSSLSLNRIVEDNKTESLMIAEILVPQHSIATLTNIDDANRINMVVHGNVSAKTLVRQQTFPPIQPISRVRHFSTAEELAFGVEPVAEDSAQTTSSPCSQVDSIASPSPLPDRPEEEDSEKSDDSKSDEPTDSDAEKPEEGNKFEKENRDPKVVNLNFSRRSSAPTTSDNANDIPRLDERRCSVPIESHSNGDSINSEAKNENVESKSTLNKDCDIDNSKENACPEKDSYVEESTEKSSNQGSFKTRNKKKYLQRRLSGGTEIFQTAGAAPNDKSENSNQTQTESSSGDADEYYGDRAGTKRRSSLPSEAFTKTDKSN